MLTAMHQRDRQVLVGKQHQKGYAWQTFFFLVVSVIGGGLLFGYTTSFPAMQDPALFGPRCLANAAVTRYDFLPDRVNEVLCNMNSVFRALKRSAPGELVAGQFAALCFIAVVIHSYESFRQTGFLARRGQILLFISQLCSAAATFPIYYAIVAWSRSPASMAKRPQAHQIWSILLSTIIGYLGPTWYLAKEDSSYNALSIWQIYPIFIIGLNIVLPIILKPFFKNTSPLTPIYIILAISIFVSAKAHFAMLASGIAFQDVVMLFKQPTGLSTDAHRLFLVDFLTSVVSTLCFVVFTFDSASAEHKFGYFTVFVTIVNLFGPGGAIAVIWALREIMGVSALQQREHEASQELRLKKQ